MAIKIEVDPLIAGAALRTSQQIAIEGSRFGQGCDGKCQVKGLHKYLGWLIGRISGF
jgi:hypothetical protein